ncbi:MAG: STAS domain-containing protein [Actinomycetota bacterium]|nr:STAS domain-containing protein [Actinomycetota bacterium]
MTNAPEPNPWQPPPPANIVQPSWKLSVQHYPTVDICAVVVEGELDLLTAPLLGRCVRQQLVAAPQHLILDLEAVGFMGSRGLNCLLRARQLTQTRGIELHLAGLATRAISVPMKLAGLLGVFSTYPTLVHAVMELADRPDATSQHIVPPPMFTAFWRRLMSSVWILELCECDAGTGQGAIVDWINSGTPATQPPPETAQELLAARGLWLFPDTVTGSATRGRHRIGYVCADAEVVVMAHVIRDDAALVGLHPMMLATWITAGYSLTTATGWIRAGCLFPH